MKVHNWRPLKGSMSLEGHSVNSSWEDATWVAWTKRPQGKKRQASDGDGPSTSKCISQVSPPN